MRRVIFTAIAFFLLSLTSAFASGVSVSKSFIKANEAYETGDYAQATELYEAIVQEVKSGALYYNLGNSYFKEGKIGYALANYLRAKRYIPNDSDLNDNIRYLQTFTKDTIENKNLFCHLYKIFFFCNIFSTKLFFYIFTFFNAAFFLLLIIKKGSLNWLRNLTFILLILSAIALALNYNRYYNDKNGVIIKSEVSVKSGSSLNDTTLFNLHEGTVLRVIGESGDWLKIRLLDNKKGWVLRKVVEPV